MNLESLCFMVLLSLAVVVQTQGIQSRSLQSHDTEPDFPPHTCESSTDSSSVRFVIKNRRNETGHWITEVKFKHGEDDEGPYEVDVEQKTSGYACDSTLDISATVSGPPRKGVNNPSPNPVHHTYEVPSGYELFEGIGYYKFYETPVTWNEGHRKCIEEGGYLAIINSISESKVLETLFKRHSNIPGVTDAYSASIGFHDCFAEGDYVTVFGGSLQSAGFQQWSTIGGNQPDNAGGNENCGSVHRNGLLNDINCKAKIPFICEFTPRRSCSVTRPPSDGWSRVQPPADYTFYPGAGFYKVHSTLATWDEGRKTCEREGAHLVIINSVAESNVLKTIIGQVPKTFSMGFHDRFVEGEYITIFGLPLKDTGFYEWSTSGAKQPDNAGGNENCGSLHNNGLLNDINCSAKNPFICEFTPRKTEC